MPSAVVTALGLGSLTMPKLKFSLCHPDDKGQKLWDHSHHFFVVLEPSGELSPESGELGGSRRSRITGIAYESTSQRLLGWIPVAHVVVSVNAGWR